MLYYFRGDIMKIKLAVTIDEEIVEKIKLMADEESRSISSQINKILKDFISG